MLSSLLLGVLQPASAAPDPTRLALEAITAPYVVAPIGTVPLGGPAGPDGYGPRGVAVQLAPTLDGLPVDALRIVRLDPAGRVVSVTGDGLPPVAHTAGAPMSISEARAQAIAAAVVGGSAIGARLSWQPVRGELRRVWTIEREGPPVPPGPLGLGAHAVPQVRIDAVTGAVLAVTEGATHGAAPIDFPLARAYPHNPVVDLQPVEVTLPLAAEALSDDRLYVTQCRDLGETRVSTGYDGEDYDLHVCSVVDAATPVDGSYLYDPDPYPADPARDEDDFAAANVYWNVHQGLDWFEALGWVPVDGFDPRLEVTVNYRVTDLASEPAATDPTQPLAPYRNAYFTGGYEAYGGEWVGARLVFGQGPDTDFGYCADVIHHELGHFVVRSRSGPSWSPDGPYGPSIRARALNEAYADYFSSAIHGDPLVSEYAAGDGEPIRDLTGGETCGASLWGESHYDSLPFSTALWEVRASLPPGDQPAFDRAVLDSLSIIGLGPDFPDAAAAVEDLAAAALGEAVGDAAWAAFEARGIHDCPPVNDVAVGPEPFRAGVLVDGAYWWSDAGVVPAPIQYRIDLPDGGAQVRLTFEQSELVGFEPFVSPPEPLGLVGRSGAEPIVWTVQDATTPYTTTGGGTFDVLVDAWVPDATVHGEAVEVDVVPHEEDERYLMHRYELVWEVDAGGPYVFQLTNAHPRSAVALDLAVTVEPIVADTTGDTGATAPTEPTAPADPKGEDEQASGGCGCSGTGGAADLGALLALGLIGARRSRRSVPGQNTAPTLTNAEATATRKPPPTST
jgi:hypothetical protein